MIWLTSDLHLGHDKEFVWKERGFGSVQDMDESLVSNFNQKVQLDDDVYILGDLILGDTLAGLEKLKQLNGKLHIIRGNHDTDARWRFYRTLPNVVALENALTLKYNKYHFWLSHYPTITSNNDYDKPLRQRLLNLCGHSHTFEKWEDADKGYIYHVEVEAHNNAPVSLDQIIEDFKTKFINEL